jgi:hypothetical protein
MLQIRPFSTGEHPFPGGSAAFLEFRETTHLDVVYREAHAREYTKRNQETGYSQLADVEPQS